MLAGLASVVLAGCSTCGAGSYGSDGRSSPSYGYSTPYSYVEGRYATPRAYDRAYDRGYGFRGYSRSPTALATWAGGGTRLTKPAARASRHRRPREPA